MHMNMLIASIRMRVDNTCKTIWLANRIFFLHEFEQERGLLFFFLIIRVSRRTFNPGNHN